MEILDDGLIAATSKGTVRRVISIVREHVPSRLRVLDAPAGPGAVSKILSTQGYAVTTLDLDATAFHSGGGAPLVIADMNERLPFEAGSFECVVCVDGIEHLENPYRLIREFERVLTPSGHLLISTPNISAFRSRVRYLLTGFHNKGKKPLVEDRPTLAQHINLMSFPTLRYALHRFGFKIVKISANRVKWQALPSMLLYPLALLTTGWPMRRERHPGQRKLNRDIYSQCLSWPVCMGETLIVVAVKKSDTTVVPTILPGA